MFKQLLYKLDQDINHNWDFCDGYGNCVRWPITGGQVVKSYKLDESTIDSMPYSNKEAEDLF